MKYLFILENNSRSEQNKYTMFIELKMGCL